MDSGSPFLGSASRTGIQHVLLHLEHPLLDIFLGAAPRLGVGKEVCDLVKDLADVVEEPKLTTLFVPWNLNICLQKTDAGRVRQVGRVG